MEERVTVPTLPPGRSTYPLSAAVAADRRAALALGRPLPDRGPGAVLVADVTGFSSLASRLVREHGEAGACDALTGALNSQLGTLIDAVRAHQGVVVGFAGDALRAYFPPLESDRDEVGPPLRMLAAWRACVEWPPSTATPMRLGFGGACGEIERITAGDPSIRLFDAIAGPVVSAAEAAQRSAGPGRLVLDAAAGALLQPWADGSRTDPSGSMLVTRWRLPPPPVEPADDDVLEDVRLSAWLDARIRRQLLTLGTVPAEIRLVRPVFIGYRLLEPASSGIAPIVSALTGWVQSVVHGLGGCVMHVLPSGRRGYLAAAFGAPTTYLDDGDRAAQAARLLSRPPADLARALATAVGASEGRAWTGLCGSPRRFAYTLVGDAANLAARLMAAARPGTALITSDLARSATGHRFAEPVEMRLKGQSGPVTARRLLGRRPGRQSGWAELPLTGRDRELARIEAVLETPGARLLVRGPAGVGKSRLSAELCALVEARGRRTIRLYADPIDAGDPLYPWPHLIGELLGLSGDASPGAVRAVVAQRFPHLRAQVPLLGSLLRLPSQDDEPDCFLTGEARLRRVAQLLVDMIASGSEQGSTLIIEDVQWLSSAARAVLDHVWAWLPGVVVVATARPEGGARLAAIHPGTVTLDLSPLDEQASLALMRAAAGGRHIGPAVASFVQDRAGGHPFFTLELVAGLRRAGLLGAGSREPSLELLDALDAPYNVEAAIAARLDELQPRQQRVLRIASVIGGPMDTAAVCALMPTLQPAAVRRMLVALRSSDWLSGGPIEYRFGHELTRRVVYNRIPARERSSLHDAVARFYEGRPGVPDAVLARHLDQANRPDDTIPHLERAARNALRHGAFSECARFLDRARRLAEGRARVIGADRLADWEWTASQALYRLGRLSDALEASRAAASQFDRPIPAALTGLGGHFTRQLVRQVWHRVRGRPSRAPSIERSHAVRAAGVYQQLSELYFLTGDLPRSAFTALRQLNLAERAGPTVGLAQAYGSACILAGMMGLHPLARTYAELGRKAASEVPDPGALASLLHQTSLYHSGIGAFEAVARDEDEAMLIFADRGDRGRVRDCLTIAGVAAWLSGDSGRTGALFGRLSAERDPGETFLQDVWSTIFVAGVNLRQGRIDAAIESLRAALDRLAREPIRIADLACRGLLAEALWRRGRRDGALAFTTSLLQLLSETRGRPPGYPALDGYWAALRLSRLAGRSTTRRAERLHWEALATQAAGYLERYRRMYPIGAPRALLGRGLLLLDAGQTRLARRTLRAAAAEADRLGMRWDAAEIATVLRP